MQPLSSFHMDQCEKHYFSFKRDDGRAIFLFFLSAFSFLKHIFITLFFVFGVI